MSNKLDVRRPTPKRYSYAYAHCRLSLMITCSIHIAHASSGCSGWFFRFGSPACSCSCPHTRGLIHGSEQRENENKNKKWMIHDAAC